MTSPDWIVKPGEIYDAAYDQLEAVEQEGYSKKSADAIRDKLDRHMEGSMEALHAYSTSGYSKGETVDKTKAKHHLRGPEKAASQAESAQGRMELVKMADASMAVTEEKRKIRAAERAAETTGPEEKPEDH